MVEIPDFSARLDMALAMNGRENAWLAEQLGPTPQHGQSLINGWRRRGKIGQPSERKVERLLPATNMRWLQFGEGEPGRINPFKQNPNQEPAHSQLLRPDPAMLVAAYSAALFGLGRYGVGQKDLNLLHMLDAVRLCDVYALLAGNGGVLPGGEHSLELKAAIEQRAHDSGEAQSGEIVRTAGTASPAGRRGK